jgi:hypothetical protein
LAESISSRGGNVTLSDQTSRDGVQGFARPALALVGFALFGYGVIVALENATGMKIQAGPLAAIILGFVIAAAGVLWHLQTSRTERPASARVVPSLAPSGSPPATPDTKPSDAAAAKDRVATAPPLASEGDKAQAQHRDQATAKDSAPVAVAAVPAARADMSDAEFKAATLALAGKMRVFEQSYDSKRYQIFDKPTDNQQERDEQIQELKALQSDKVSNFTKDILPQALFVQNELLRRLEQRGITDVPMPPPPAGTSIAMGRRLLQVDVSDVGLLGHQPLHGLAAYLELLASKLTD